jgi:hypothetical protein
MLGPTTRNMGAVAGIPYLYPPLSSTVATVEAELEGSKGS